ncbi:hypothetical protein EVAR_72102_1 [Eumeta japonica]|uniref:Uncharacterized protein n=1 Tax=Eumeta variegata TaxID=151549 RepID=A0A4C1SIK7_EUMVA|nr:hypothetical protein EVAR_72102_1 [Eumeta japonica]
MKLFHNIISFVDGTTNKLDVVFPSALSHCRYKQQLISFRDSHCAQYDFTSGLAVDISSLLGFRSASFAAIILDSILSLFCAADQSSSESRFTRRTFTTCSLFSLEHNASMPQRKVACRKHLPYCDLPLFHF